MSESGKNSRVKSLMNDKYFLDTNIFVYSFDSSQPEKQEIAGQLIKNGIESGLGCISYQVIQEFLNVAGSKFATPLSSRDRKIYLSNILEPMCEIYSSIELYHLALEISERWKYGFYDSLIIASALQNNCNILYSEDLQSGQFIQNMKIVDPFLR